MTGSLPIESGLETVIGTKQHRLRTSIKISEISVGDFKMTGLLEVEGATFVGAIVNSLEKLDCDEREGSFEDGIKREETNVGDNDAIEEANDMTSL